MRDVIVVGSSNSLMGKGWSGNFHDLCARVSRAPDHLPTSVALLGTYTSGFGGLVARKAPQRLGEVGNLVLGQRLVQVAHFGIG